MASRHGDDAMAGLIRRSLARGTESGKDCPDSDLLAAYYERSLGADEVARCEEHFSRCSHCRAQLALIAQSEDKPHPVPARSWAWDWRWLVATAAVLIFVLSWTVKRATRVTQNERSSQTPPLLAQSEPNQAPAPASEPPITPALTAPPRDIASATNPESLEREKQALTGQGANRELDARATARGIPANAPASTETDALKEPAPSLGNDSNAQQAKKANDAAPEPGEGGAASSSRLQSSSSPPSSIGGIVGGAAPNAAPAAVPPQANGGASRTLRTPRRNSVARLEQPDAAASINSPTPLAGVPQSATATRQTDEQRSDQILIRTPDPKILWRITGGSFVERTTDGGATWQGQLPDANAQWTAGAAPSGKICWLVGRSGAILTTKDGMNWKKIPPPVPADFVAVTAKSASDATLTAADGQKFTTSDGGKKWKPAQ